MDPARSAHRKKRKLEDRESIKYLISGDRESFLQIHHEQKEEGN